MKVIESENSVNFVDQNNVFVGYELGSFCCEWADWFISDSVTEKVPVNYSQEIEANLNKVKDLDEYIFDKEFLKIEDNYKVNDGSMNNDYRIIFRLTAEDKEKFLYLFNVQNGYYSHGFTVKIDDKVFKEGEI